MNHTKGMLEAIEQELDGVILNGMSAFVEGRDDLTREETLYGIIVCLSGEVAQLKASHRELKRSYLLMVGGEDDE